MGDNIDDELANLTEEQLHELLEENDLSTYKEPTARRASAVSPKNYSPSKLRTHLKMESLDYCGIDKKEYAELESAASQARRKSEHKAVTDLKQEGKSGRVLTRELSVDTAELIGDASENELIALLNELNDMKTTAGVTGTKEYKVYAGHGENDVDLEALVKKLSSNDPSLKILNLNNHVDIFKHPDLILPVAKTLMKNEHVEKFYASNCHLNDDLVGTICRVFRTNKTIKELNLESNSITGKAIVDMFDHLKYNTTLTHIKLSNQSKSLGVVDQQKIAKALESNEYIIRLGLHLSDSGSRFAIDRILSRNSDKARERRNAERKKNQK